MIDWASRPDGGDPQAESLRTLIEGLIDEVSQEVLPPRIDALNFAVDHGEALDQRLILANQLIEHLDRALDFRGDLIRQLGDDNRRQVESINTLRGGLVELERKLKLAGLTQKQQRALIRFLREQQGGIVLQSGEPPMNKPCRGLPLEAIAIAIVLGCIFGTVIDRWGWITGLNNLIGKPTLVASILVIVAVIARLLIHKASNTAEWQEFYKPVDWLVAKFCKWTGHNPPAPKDPPPEIALRRDEERAIRERAVDGLDAKRIELNNLQQRIIQLQGELDAKTLEITQKTGEIEVKRGELANLNSILTPLLVPPVPPAVRDQAAVDAATASMRSKCTEIDGLVISLQTIVGQANQKRTDLEDARTLLNGPDGLDEEVKDLESQCKQKLDAAKTLEDEHNAKVSAPRWHYFTKWKALAFGFVLLMVAGLWDAADVNKVIGQSQIAEGKSPGVWVSGGETMADPNKRDQYVHGIDELPLGKDGPVTAIKLPNGRIVVFLGAGEITPEARRNIELSEYSAPR